MTDSKWTKKLQKWLSPEAAEKAQQVFGEDNLQKLVEFSEKFSEEENQEIKKDLDEVEKLKPKRPIVEDVKEEVFPKNIATMENKVEFEAPKKQKPIYVSPNRVKKEGKPVVNAKMNLPVATISHSPQEKVGRLADEIQEKIDRLDAEAKHYKNKYELGVNVISSLREENSALRKRIEVLQKVADNFENKCDETFVQKAKPNELSDLGKLFT